MHTFTTQMSSSSIALAVDSPPLTIIYTDVIVCVSGKYVLWPTQRNNNKV